MTTIPRHTRVVDGFTAPAERRVLRFLANRTPARVSPDMLTFTGLGGAALAGAGYSLTHLHASYLWLASLGLAVNWLGDSMDGTLARHRHIERPRYGFFIDHTVDALSAAMILLGFGISPYVEFEIACLLLIGYLLLAVVASARVVADGVFRISYGRLGPTEARIALVLTNSGVFFGGNPTVRLPFATTTLIDLLAVLATAWLVAAFVVAVARQARRLSASPD